MSSRGAVNFALRPDGTRVAWTETGSGEPVLLIMGYGLTKEFWYRVVPALATRHRVITFDNRGVGDTVMADGPFTIADMAADAVAVLDAAGVRRAHVYGASMGGGIAQEMALGHPERVASLVLACTAAKATVTDLPKRRLFIFGLVPRVLVNRLLGRSMYGHDADPRRVREDRRVLNAMRITRAGLAGQSRAVALYTSRDRVGTITAPTLVLHGTADRAVPYAAGEELAALIPGAKLVTLEGAGHSYVTESTEEANEAVLHFLARVAAVA